MPPAVQVGAILLDQSAQMMQLTGLESDPYSGTWGLVRALDGFALDRKIRELGWRLLFMAAEVKAVAFGALGPDKIQTALKRVLEKVEQQHFNGLEVTGIVAKHFLGLHYVIVSAHSRHLQQGCYLDGAEKRRTSHSGAEWARS